jgi:GT2 family glycosyltransferase
MESPLPAVVAVVATSDAGEWLDATLRSLTNSDYANLSILVLAQTNDASLSDRVATAAPGAFVRQVDHDLVGYGAISNLVTSMVDGAPFFLLCHDDVVVAKDAVSQLVEASVKENAGIVTPKYVAMGNDQVLLHVGQNADRTGAVSERISVGEVDHGQHDVVRDVFVAPGGVTLVRSDLFAEIQGFDPEISAMAEDLELSWRAQVAGARVVVAPLAKVAHVHLQGERMFLQDQPSLQALQRRHELRAVLVNSSSMTLLLVLPLLVLLNVAEYVVAALGHDHERSTALRHIWGWNFGQRSSLRRRRKLVHDLRTVSDRDLHDKMANGSMRLKTFATRLFYQGLEAARGAVGLEPPSTDMELTATIGEAFSENQDFDDLDDLGHHGSQKRTGTRRLFVTRSGRATAAGLALFVFLFGSRNLLFAKLSNLGQFGTWPSFTGAFQHLFASWHPTFLGSTAPAPTTFGTMGFLGLFTLGHMGLAQDLALVGSLPVGIAGIRRLVAPFVSPRSKLLASFAYGCIGLWPAAVSFGAFDGVIAVAVTPWIILGLLKVARVQPFEVTAPAVRFGWPGFRRSWMGRLLTLSVLVAMAASFAPALLIVVLVVGLALMVADGIFGLVDGARVLRVGIIVTVLAAVLSFPWVMGILLHPASALSVFGLPANPATAPTLQAIVTFSIGRAQPTWWSWALLAGAVLPLLVVRGQRLIVATRLSVVALASWALAAASAWHLLGVFTPNPMVVLAPAAVAVACLVGLALSGFEVELGDHSFGWRQLATVAGLTFSATAVMTIFVALPSGTWGLGSVGVDQSLDQVSRHFATTGGRVLWLGDPRVLPVSGASVEPGLAYATTTSTVTSTWSAVPAGDPGAAVVLGEAVSSVLHGTTSTVGRQLAGGGIAYVVVIESAAPSIAEVVTSTPVPAPAALLQHLRVQHDLLEISSSGGLEVFQVTDALSLPAGRSAPAPSGPVTTGSTLTGWTQAMAPAPDELAKSGPVANGTVVVAAAPAGSLELRVNGAVQPHSDGPAGSASFATPAGTGELSVVTSPLVPLLVTAMVALWVVVALGCSGRLGSLIAGIGRLGRSSAKDAVDEAHSSDDGPNSGGDPT